MDKSTGAIFWLKEFSKAWVNIISDEAVYHEQVLEGQPGGVISFIGNGRTYIKEYLSGNIWLEILLKIRRCGEFELYTALVEVDESVHREVFGMSQASRDEKLGYTRENKPMFVNVVDNGKNPEGMSSRIPIRSVIRLHRLDVIPNIFAKFFESFSETSAVLDVNWEDSALTSLDSERPSDVIKGATKTVSNFPYQKSPCERVRLGEIRVEDIASIIRVFIDSTSVRLTCDEGLDFSVEDIKVFLRPIDSSEGPSRWLHMLSPYE